MEYLRPSRLYISQPAGAQRPLDVARRPGGVARVLEHVAAEDEVERLLAELALERPRAAADVRDAVDIGAFGKVEPDEVRLGAEPFGYEAAPVAHVALGKKGARSHLQPPRCSLADRLGHPVEQQIDLTRNARADDPQLTGPPPGTQLPEGQLTRSGSAGGINLAPQIVHAARTMGAQFHRLLDVAGARQGR